MKSLPNAPSRHLRMTDSLFGFLLIIPALLVFLCVIAVPILRGIYISFCDCKIATLQKPVWDGLSNYRAIFTDGSFFQAFGTTLIFCGCTVAVVLVGGLGLALLLNTRIHGRGIIRSLMIIPWCIPSVVIAVIWRWMFNQSFGVVNWFIYKLGLSSTTGINWIMNDTLAMALIVMACSWKQLPYMMVMMLAAVQSVDETLKEAARVDGANALHVFWNVTLPSIRTVVVTCTWLSITRNFQQYTMIKNITGGGPVNATSTLSIAAYLQAFTNSDFGKAAAIGVMWMLFLMIITVLVNRLNDRLAQDIQ